MRFFNELLREPEKAFCAVFGSLKNASNKGARSVNRRGLFKYVCGLFSEICPKPLNFGRFHWLLVGGHFILWSLIPI